MSDSDDELNSQDKGLTSLPLKEPSWSSIKILNLATNDIEHIDASQLPPILEYLDLSDNPLRIIKGRFPETLKHLILRNTRVGKLPLLPETLIELVIQGSPISKKYDMESQTGISDKITIQRISGKPFEKYETMLDNSQKQTKNNIKVNIKVNSNLNESNSEINMTNIGGAMIGGDQRSSTPLVMILDHRETDDDIIYQVLTLNAGEKEVMKQFLEPFEPMYANEAPTIPLVPGKPSVYLNSSHGEDIFFEKPVPPGCMYITLHECGISTRLRNFYNIMLAFDDIPKGIKAKLRDPLKYKDELAKEFGFTFHIHYPEAPHPSDRTYLESIKFPFVNFNDTKAFIKSGMFSLDNDNHFTDTSKEEGVEQVTHEYTGSFTKLHLLEMYEDSIFPTYDLVKHHLANSEPTYGELNNLMKKFKCTQSWLFKKFPGIHYNFSCRAIFHHNYNNERIYQRRRKSLEGAEAYINQMSNNAIQSKATREMLERYQDEGVPHMIEKLVNRGINLNEPSEYSELRPLQEAVAFMQKDIVAVLVKAKGIDKSHTDNLLKQGFKYKLSKARTKEEKQEIRETAAEIHRLLHPVRRSKTYSKRKTTRRKTRRLGSFKR